jgi:hypothetical protein
MDINILEPLSVRDHSPNSTDSAYALSSRISSQCLNSIAIQQLEGTPSLHQPRVLQSHGYTKGPGIRSVRGQGTVDGEVHDSTFVVECDDQDHERREIKLVGKGEDSKADDDTDGGGAGVDGIVAHTLEDLA